MRCHFCRTGEENDMEVLLVIVKADGTTRDFPLTAQRTVIGRQNTCGLRIPLHSVSRKHCEVQMLDEQLVVRDLGSSNGTQINDQKVTGTAKLKAGDRLQLGPVIFTVVVDGYPEVVDASMTLINQAHQVESETREAAPQKASAKSGSRHVLSTPDGASHESDTPDKGDLYDLTSDPANSGINKSQDSNSGSSIKERADAAESALADLDALLATPLDSDNDDDDVLEILEAADDDMAGLQAKAEGKSAIENATADASAETAEVQMVEDDESLGSSILDADDPLASLEAMTDDLLDDDDDLFSLDDSDLK